MPLPLPPRGGWAGRAGAEGALSLALSSADQTSPLRVSSLNLRSLEPPEIGGVSASPSLLLAFPRPPHGASRVHIGEPGLRLKRELLRGHDLQGGGGGACRGSACLPGLEQAPRASHFQTHLGASLRPPPPHPHCLSALVDSVYFLERQVAPAWRRICQRGASGCWGVAFSLGGRKGAAQRQGAPKGAHGRTGRLEL